MSEEAPKITTSPPTTQNPTPEQQQQPQPQTVSALQILIKFMIDSQNNINKLIAMQEQQMVYINTMHRHVINEPGSNSSSSTTNGVSTDQSKQQTTTTNKPSNNKPIPKKN